MNRLVKSTVFATTLMTGLWVALPLRADNPRQADVTSGASESSGATSDGVSNFDSELPIGLLIEEPGPTQKFLLDTPA